MSFSGQIYPEDTVGYFRIASKTGRHPVEPVCVGEFRIGSGSNCHLRFGESDVSEVCAVLNVERDVVLLQSAVSGSPVVVNGSPTVECRLADGDLLEIGEQRLLFRLATCQNRITLDEEAFAVSEEQNNQRDTPEQLVDRLSEQIELVEELAHTPDTGIVELMQAVAEAGSSDQSRPAAEEATELEQVKALLLKHHEASRIRLESLTEVLDSVVRQQKLIADTLEVMSERIQAVNTDGGYSQSQRRASA